LKKEFGLLEQREKFFEEKLQSKPKVSRKRLQEIEEFDAIDKEYSKVLDEIEQKTVKLREKLCILLKITDEFYFTHR